MTPEQRRPATELTPNAQLLLKRRYLQPNETISEAFVRWSMGNPDYLKMLSALDFLPNSPTLFNLGTESGGTLSACSKFNIPDSMEAIFDVGKKAGMFQKHGGGVGYVLSELRPKGAPVTSTHGKAMGPVAVMRWLHAGSKMITQGGKRDGAQMAILSCEHPDIEEFIDSKSTPKLAKELSTFNISVALTDGFMAKAIDDPDSNEAALLEKMARNAWRTGDPGCYFIDAAERGNPTPELGKLDGTNPCAEVPLLNDETCNLSSINVANFVDSDGFLWGRLENTVRLGVRYLDEIIDRNEFPDPAITAANLRTRKIGLGVMGWADALCILNIHYDSTEAVKLAEDLMRFINSVARSESNRIAELKGNAPAFKYAPWFLRNATRTCIAPTGTISILAGCSSGIEPHFDLEWIRITGDGIEMAEKIEVIERSNGFVPKVSREIHWRDHINMQAAFQRYVDLAVSKTINMPNSATWEEIRDAYIYAWRLNLKGITVYRDGCRPEQVLNSLEPFPVGSAEELCPECRTHLVFAEGCESCPKCGYSACSI